MHGSLPNSEQLKVFWKAAHGTRKVIVATNIAETSVTIPNISYGEFVEKFIKKILFTTFNLFFWFLVIDSGFVKIPWFEVETQTNSLIIAPISKASADQRAGRAGRIRPGKAYR